MSNDVSLLETRDIYEDSAFSNNIPHIVNGSRVKINLIHTSVRPRPRRIVAFCSFVSKHATFSKGILSAVQFRSEMKRCKFAIRSQGMSKIPASGSHASSVFQELPRVVIALW
ncbi:uncharacterized protein LOC116414127 isoform X1 [Apis florea]|uniref:uncharacterized protein LOC116414127 isoform X1 n=1 Tax=Apis florea TaxID=7463 RepID=UPI0012FE87E4|nr:uncharacterized protein LOC116414127 isoform X1 [Apis florea]